MFGVKTAVNPASWTVPSRHSIMPITNPQFHQCERTLAFHADLVDSDGNTGISPDEASATAGRPGR